MGLSTDENERDFKELKKRKISLEVDLKKKVAGQKRQREFRKATKTRIQTVVNMNPEAKQVLFDRVRLAPGRPRLEEDQVGLFKSICDIAIFGSAAHERRQSDIIRSIKTLDELTEELKKLGYRISRSATYLRLLPRRCNTTEGKRHITTVPVKLIRAQNDAHKKHIDGKFCTATINALEELASVLGPKEVCFLSF